MGRHSREGGSGFSKGGSHIFEGWVALFKRWVGLWEKVGCLFHSTAIIGLFDRRPIILPGYRTIGVIGPVPQVISYRTRSPSDLSYRTCQNGSFIMGRSESRAWKSARVKYRK